MRVGSCTQIHFRNRLPPKSPDPTWRTTRLSVRATCALHKTARLVCRLLSWSGFCLFVVGDGGKGGGNVSHWDIKSCCWWPGLPVGQHYKESCHEWVHSYKSIPILISTINVCKHVKLPNNEAKPALERTLYCHPESAECSARIYH